MYQIWFIIYLNCFCPLLCHIQDNIHQCIIKVLYMYLYFVYKILFSQWVLVFILSFSDIGFFRIPSDSSPKQISHDVAWLKTVQGHETPVSKIHFCSKCGKVYSRKTTLLRHLRLECGKIPQLQCPHCPYITKRKSSLHRHVSHIHVTWT